LIFKKKFRADFKDFLLNSELTNEKKVEEINDDFFDIFEQIENLLLSLT